MKIDIFCHIIAPAFAEAVERLNLPLPAEVKNYRTQSPPLYDLEQRFRIMDKYDDYMQVLTVATFHNFARGDKAVELAKIANDELAELVSKYPDRFATGIANLPMTDIETTLLEVDRAVNDLKLRGVEIWALRDGTPIDSPEFMPLYEKMCQYNLPILIHPFRGVTAADYSCEKESKYRIYSTFGWPYDTTVAMTRLVFSQVLEKFPNIKFITHHCGAMVPFFATRIISHCDFNEMRRGEKHHVGLTKHPIEYYRMFYNDTALSGGTSALMCAYDFFGADRLLFGTDMPMDSLLGISDISSTIQAIEQMDIPDSDKQKIFEGNARKLLRLPI